MMRTGYIEGVSPSNEKLLIEIGGLPREFTRPHFSEITGLKIDDLYNKKDYEYKNIAEKRHVRGDLQEWGPCHPCQLCSSNWVQQRVGGWSEKSLFSSSRLPLQRAHPGPTNNSHADLYKDCWWPIRNQLLFPGKCCLRPLHGHREVIRYQSRGKNLSKTRTVHLEAFLLLLQVWVYECIPKIMSMIYEISWMTQQDHWFFDGHLRPKFQSLPSKPYGCTR